MEKKGIRKLALILAVLQSMGISHAKANSNDHLFCLINRFGKLEMVDDKRIIINDGKSFVEDGDTISIYNEENTISKQFGGSQKDFSYYYDELIKDPYILDNMQSVFPNSIFPSKKKEMLFYKEFFEDIKKQGCGYVSLANAVFHCYEGREEDFIETFGYPMYVIREDNSIDFNYEYFILGFFLNNITYPKYDIKKIMEITHKYDKTIAKNELDEYLKSDEYRNFEEKDWRQLEGQEQLDYIEQYQNRIYKLDELTNNVEKSTDKDINFCMSEDNALGHIRDYLNKHGISVNIDITNFNIHGSKFRDFQPGDIIVFEGLVMYKYDEVLDERYSEVRILNRFNPSDNSGVAHSVNIVSIDNGKVIVSSLGERYILDEEKSTPSIRIRLNIPLKEKAKVK